MPLFQKMKQQKLLSFALLLTTLAVAIVIGTMANTGVKADRQVSSIAPDASPLNIPKADPIANEFTKLTKKVEPSVVYIESDYLPKQGKRGIRPKDDSEDEDNGAADQKIRPRYSNTFSADHSSARSALRVRVQGLWSTGMVTLSRTTT